MGPARQAQSARVACTRSNSPPRTTPPIPPIPPIPPLPQRSRQQSPSPRQPRLGRQPHTPWLGHSLPDPLARLRHRVEIAPSEVRMDLGSEGDSRVT